MVTPEIISEVYAQVSQRSPEYLQQLEKNLGSVVLTEENGWSTSRQGSLGNARRFFESYRLWLPDDSAHHSKLSEATIASVDIDIFREGFLQYRQFLRMRYIDNKLCIAQKNMTAKPKPEARVDYFNCNTVAGVKTFFNRFSSCVNWSANRDFPAGDPYGTSSPHVLRALNTQ